MGCVPTRWTRHALLGLCLVLTAGGCRDIVYRDRELFQEPVAAAAGFVGYSDAQRKLTVCGNCHTSVQRQWQETAHSDAFETLLGLGPDALNRWGQQHTVNQLGNITTGPAGWAAVRDVRFHDVQCESCHGPGLDHARGPTRDNWPLAPIGTGTLENPQGCAQCHSGELYPYHDEWARSAHGRVPNTAPPGNTNPPANRAECRGCHTGEDALVYWGVRAEFAEKRTHVANMGQNLAITCGVCHDPHRNDIPGQLRFSVTVPSEEDNLCMKCHHKRGNPDFGSGAAGDVGTFRGPHSPEGPTLLGYAGAWIGRMEFPDTIYASHGSERNPRLCAGCHVNAYDTTDPVTGATIRTTGHTFDALPCLDANGLPTECTPTSVRSYRTCTDAGCHASEQVARSLEQRAEERVLSLTNELSGLLQAAHRQGGRTDNWWNCRGSGNCPGSPLHWGAGQQRYNWTVALSAAWNFELVRRNTGGGGALRQGQVNHNPVLIEVLLISSIREMRREYNLPAVTSVSLQRQFGIGNAIRSE